MSARVWSPRHSVVAGILVVLLLVLPGCGKTATAGPDSTDAAGAATVGSSTTSTATGETEDPFRAVFNPYHNPYGDLVGVYVDRLTFEIDPAVIAVDLPAVVPAYLADIRPLPNTDLDFGNIAPQDPEFVRPYLWGDPDAEGLLFESEPAGPDTPPLAEADVALESAHSFLERHGLWQPDLGSGRVSEGSSVTGGTKTVTSWNVRFEQELPPELAGTFSGWTPGAVSVRVGPPDRPIQIKWYLLELVRDGSLRLRPVADVLADVQAWRDGSISIEVNQWLQPEMHIEVTAVKLGLDRVNGAKKDDLTARYLVPVYEFTVAPIAADGSRGQPGVWTVVAAEDVRR